MPWDSLVLRCTTHNMEHHHSMLQRRCIESAASYA